MSGDGSEVKPPRVLISYSHESDEHRARVLALAQQLRKDGVDARLDRFVAPPPEGWSHWMEGELKEADRIIVVCTPTYSARASRDAAAGVGLGVSWEWNLIRKEVYETRGGASRIVPVFFDAEGAASVPKEVWDRPRHDVGGLDGPGHLSLLDDLFSRPEIAVGPVGPARSRPPPVVAAPVRSGGGDEPPTPHADPPKAREALERLLLDLFSLAELRRFIVDQLGGDDLLALLPSHGPAEEYVFLFVSLLERRGQINEPLFQSLVRERATRQAEIEFVASIWGLRLSVRAMVSSSGGGAGGGGRGGDGSGGAPGPREGQPRKEPSGVHSSEDPKLVLLQSAIKAVPSLKYALGVAGVAAAASILIAFLGGVKAGLAGVVLMVLLMTLLVVFASAANEGTIGKWPAQVLIWFSLFLVIACTPIGLLSAFRDDVLRARETLCDVSGLMCADDHHVPTLLQTSTDVVVAPTAANAATPADAPPPVRTSVATVASPVEAQRKPAEALGSTRQRAPAPDAFSAPPIEAFSKCHENISSNNNKDIVILDKIEFSSESTTIHPHERTTLDAISKVICVYGLKIIVYGRADASEPDAQGLSVARAKTVADYLTKQGIDPTRLVVEGVGATTPLSDAQTTDERAINRIVSFFVLR